MSNYQTQLTNLQIAIAKIETGAVKSISILGRSTTFQDLPVLYAREKYLMNRIAVESRGGAIKVTGLKT